MVQSYRAAAAFRKRGLIATLSDLVWPPRSLLSEAIVDRPGVIEPALWGELNFLSAPVCFRCGFPLKKTQGVRASAPPARDHRHMAAPGRRLPMMTMPAVWCWN